MNDQTEIALEDQTRRVEANYPRLCKRMTLQVAEIAAMLRVDEARVRAALDDLTREAATHSFNFQGVTNECGCD